MRAADGSLSPRPPCTQNAAGRPLPRWHRGHTDQAGAGPTAFPSVPSAAATAQLGASLTSCEPCLHGTPAALPPRALPLALPLEAL